MKLESYSRISALGPVGHCTCTSHFKRAVCISCRPCVDVHKGGGGSGPCGRMWTEGGEGKKRDFFVDVINGWPHGVRHPDSYSFFQIVGSPNVGLLVSQIRSPNVVLLVFLIL